MDSIARTPWIRTAVAAGILVAVLAGLVQLALWAGTPVENARLFPLGIGVSVFSVVLLAVVSWWLLFRGAASGDPASPSRRVAGRGDRLKRALSSVLLAGLTAVTLAGFWDAAWHIRYGTPFGEDLLWRPHLLLYLGLLTIPVCGLVALIALWRRPGSWLLRLRNDRPLGAAVLLGAYFLYAIPADPAWHLVYGEDISAWSLPHLVMVFQITLMAGLAEWLRRSTRAAPRPAALWRSDTGGVAGALATALAATLGVTVMLLILAVEYDHLVAGALGGIGPIFDRPAWVFPALVVAVGAGFGATALSASRRVGVATVVGLLALALRALGTWGVPGGMPVALADLKSTLLLLPILVALDLSAWFALRSRPERGAHARRLAPAAIAGALAGTLPLLALLYPYPVVNGATLPAMILAVVAAALLSALAGSRLGAALAASGGRSAPPVEAARSEGRLPTAVGYGAATLAVIWFVVTAVPPA